MSHDDLQAKLQATRKHLEALTKQAGRGMVPLPVVQEALEELATSGEEIQVLNEELRQQNEELFATRNAVETEQQRYRDLFEFAPDGYLVTNPSGVIQEANRAAAAMLGVPQEFLLGKPLMLFVAEKDQRAFDDHLSRIEQDPATLRQWFLDLQPRGGGTFPAALTGSCVQSTEGRLVALRWLLRDVTEAKRKEEALRQAKDDLEQRVQEVERQARTLAALDRASRAVAASLDVADVLQIILDVVRTLLNTEAAGVLQCVPEEGVLVFVAAQGIGAEKLVGQRVPIRASILGQVFREQRPACIEDVWSDPRLFQGMDGLAAMPLRSLLTVPLMAHGSANGVLATANKFGGPFSADDERVLAAFASAAAISIANAQLFGEVQASQGQLRRLSQRLVEVQEAERRTLARELHDEIGQSLTVLHLLLDQVARGTRETGQPEVGQALETVQALQHQVRELALDLRPSMLDDQGLLPALIWNIERFHRRTHLHVTLKHLGLEARRLRPEVETAAYRVVQEALTNVARHAGVREAGVRLWLSETALWTQIEDQGVGFDQAAALSAHASSGLAGMRERVAMVGGHLSVESAPGSGTTILAEFPLP